MLLPRRLLRESRSLISLRARAYTTSTSQAARSKEVSAASTEDRGTITVQDVKAQPTLSHLTSARTAHMVSVREKPDTARSAVAVIRVVFSNAATHHALTTSSLSKGDALAVARVAGIMAAKRCPDLVALAHPGLRMTGSRIDIDILDPMDEPSPKSPSKAQSSDNMKYGGVQLKATVHCYGPTGVEMEALTAVTVAALNIYDMCKAVDKAMVIEGARVVSKSGGKSGDWEWDDERGEIVKI